MKSRTLTCITTFTLLSALAIPVRLAAQDHHQQPPTYSVLYTFTGGTDGAIPFAALIRDEQGNLYGTATAGGDLSCGGGGCGVVFKVDPTDIQTVLYSFTGFPDGAIPFAALIQDEQGNLYSTASAGGLGYGVVFKVDPTGKETVLYSFTGGRTGDSPSRVWFRTKMTTSMAPLNSVALPTPE